MKSASGAKFAVPSFLCVMALALSMGFALSSLLTRAAEGWEWENTAALARREAELRGIDTLLAAHGDAPIDEQGREQLARLLRGLSEVVRIKVWDTNATVLWSDEPRLIGTASPKTTSSGRRWPARSASRCDMKMPGMSDADLYDEVARRRPGIERRFVFITGDTMNPTTRQFLDRTGAPSLAKPFAIDEIRRLVPQYTALAGADHADVALRV